MKRLAALFVVSVIVSVFAFPSAVSAKINKLPFVDDTPFFVSKGKVKIPTKPIMTMKYANGSIYQRVYKYGQAFSGMFQPTITYTFAPAARNRQGLPISIFIQKDAYCLEWTQYDINYDGKQVKNVNVTDETGKSTLLTYNNDYTLQSSETRVNYRDIRNILAETVSYAYTYYNASKVKTATKTVVTYYTDPNDLENFGKVKSTDVCTEEYDKRGNLVKKTSAANDFSEMEQKFSVIGQVIDNRSSIPQGVVVVGDPVMKAAQTGQAAPVQK
jgi:hypothetical protein